ncbi:hypothetical protein ACHAXS_002365 [Conticribra weissflogii]
MILSSKDIVEIIPSVEILQRLRNNDDDITHLVINQAPRDREGIINDYYSLGLTIGSSENLQHLEIILPRSRNVYLERWRLLAEGMAGNQSIKRFSISVLGQGFTDLAQILQFFGPFLERNPNLEIFEMEPYHHLMTGEEMKVLATSLSRRVHPLESFELDCCEIDDEIILEFSAPFTRNASVTPKSIDLSPYMRRVEIGKAGLDSLVQLLESPDCSMEQLFMKAAQVDDVLIQRLAALLRSNNTLKELMLHPTEGQISISDWQKLNDVLCDRYSVDATLNSNHTLENLICGIVPSFVEDNLEMNANSDKSLIAKRKIFKVHLAGNNICMGALDEMEAPL